MSGIEGDTRSTSASLLTLSRSTPCLTLQTRLPRQSCNLQLDYRVASGASGDCHFKCRCAPQTNVANSSYLASQICVVYPSDRVSLSHCTISRSTAWIVPFSGDSFRTRLGCQRHRIMRIFLRLMATWKIGPELLLAYFSTATSCEWTKQRPHRVHSGSKIQVAGPKQPQQRQKPGFYGDFCTDESEKTTTV